MASFKKMFGLAVFASFTVHVTVLSAPVLFRSRADVQHDMGFVTVELRKADPSAVETFPLNRETPETAPLPEANRIRAKNDVPLREETVTLGNREPKYRHYLRKVKSRIESRWTYPGRAFERGERGVTTVKFSISAAGGLVGNSIMGSSGYGLLDETALSVIRAAAPYEPLPKEFNLSCLHIIASFHYNLGR